MTETLTTRLEQAQAKAMQLLTEMNEVDALLSTLTPTDPKRVELKSKKAELLPRYRGAKEQVKTLRRMVNSIPPGMKEHKAIIFNADDEDNTGPWIIPQDVSTELYDVLHGLLDRHHSTPMDRAPVLLADEVGPITAFVEWYES